MGKKILLADDSITIQKVIELTFSDEDFEVITVGNGRLAVERVQEVRPDIVLCDIIMPEKDGYEVCDFVKKTSGLSHIPVLLLTGAFEPFDKEKAERVKADGFLAKPFEPQALITKVKDLLAQGRPRAAAAPPRHATPPPAPAPAPVVAAAPPPPPATPPVTPAPRVETAVFIPDEAVEVEPEVVTPVAATPAPAPATKAAPPVEDEGFGYVDDSFEPIPEEAVAIPAAKPAPAESPAATVMFKPEVEEPWTQSTVEVSLEARARAAIQSAQAAPEPAPVFEEVDEASEEPAIVVSTSSTTPIPVVAPPPLAPAPVPPPAAAVAPPPPAPEEPPAAPPERPKAAAAVADQAEFEESSFADMAEAEKPPASAEPSAAAEVAVPVDMVEKIAQRVVAQISERVVREIAWEVIPELAEALIKQEIERLKAELQKT